MKTHDMEKDVVIHLEGLRNVFCMKSALGKEYSIEDYDNILKELDCFSSVVREHKKNKEGDITTIEYFIAKYGEKPYDLFEHMYIEDLSLERIIEDMDDCYPSVSEKDIVDLFKYIGEVIFQHKK